MQTEDNMKRLSASAWPLALALIGAAILVQAVPATAQNFPSKPITLVTASSAGGPTDAAARMIADTLSSVLGQQVVVENVAGAGGTIAMSRVARAAPDGHTLLVHQNGFAIAPALYSKLTFDIEKDFTPVIFLNRSETFIIGRKDLPANNWKELVAWMKESKQPTRFGHPGVGTFGHAQTTLLVNAIGAPTTLIAYRGIPPAVNDLLGGHIDLAQVGPPLAAPHVRSGNAKLFATTGFSRNKNFPDVPTLGEMGHPELQLWFWHALWAPAGTPKEVLDKLNEAMRKTLADERVKKNYANALVEAFPEPELTREAAEASIRKESALWRKVVEENKIKAE
jgi:tripartite-type tricarboxylate transporter receptor subunit TctC